MTEAKPLHVAIVGGGIGGAAAAYALLRQGIDVTLYEQAKAMTEIGAGVAIQPNGARMLRRLGLGAELDRQGARWRSPQIRSPDGQVVVPFWPRDFEHEIEVFGIHRADLLAMFVDRLPAAAVHVGHQCVGFEQDAHKATLTFANGRSATADVVIAADGIRSTLQRFVTPPSTPDYSGHVAHRGLVTAESVAWPAGAMRNWIGSGKRFLVYPVRGSTLINYVGFLQSDEETRESWSQRGDEAALAREFADWDPVVPAILAEAKETFRWGLYDRVPLARWADGRLALLGDAAHPMLPHGGQGANQAIEDGVALAAILSRFDAASAQQALRVYEKLRRSHTAAVQQRSRTNKAKWFAPDAERDQSMALHYQEQAWIWNYDAEAEAFSAAAAV